MGRCSRRMATDDLLDSEHPARVRVRIHPRRCQRVDRGATHRRGIVSAASWETRHRSRRLAYAIRGHEIEAAERARFYAIVGAPSSPDSLPQPSPITPSESEQDR